MASKLVLDGVSLQPLDGEIKSGIRRTKSTRLAVEYLLGNEREKIAALDGLIALCWNAKGNLFVVPERPSEPLRWFDGRRYLDNRYWATRRFILDALLEILAPYSEGDEQAVLQAALQDKFRYVPRRVRLRMVDHVRETCRRLDPAKNALSMDSPVRSDADEGIIPTVGEFIPFDFNEYCSTLGDLKPGLLSERIAQVVDLLRPEMGERPYVALCTAVELYDGGSLGRTPRDHQRRLVKEIARRRGVSVQQARRDRADLQRFTGSPLANKLRRQLRELLEGGNRPSFSIP